MRSEDVLGRFDKGGCPHLLRRVAVAWIKNKGEV